MRTTLTIDDDVAVLLKEFCSKRDAKLKTIVNEVLRAGMAVLTADRPPGPAYRTEPVSLGTPRLPSLDNIVEVLALAEGDDHR